MPPSSKHYRAFISYSHCDTEWAEWLHRSLERYVVPKDAYPPGEQSEVDGSKRSRRLTPVFRDRDEMPASGSLADTIREALESSENLIVLCSPDSATSQYVNTEIEMFRGLDPDNEQKVYALIIGGDPPDCFPPALVAGEAEPIAADAREEGDGKGDSKLKLIAGMLGVGFDRLKQREAKRQRNRLLGIVATVSVVAVMASALALWAVKAEREATTQKELAEQSAKESKAVLNFFETNVLSAAGPKDRPGGLGIDTTIGVAIDAAELQIGETFNDQALVEASIRDSLGITYWHLGKVNAAIQQFERALKLRKREQGSEHQDTLESMYWLARSYQVASRHEEAVALQEAALPLWKKVKGPEHTATLGAMFWLAYFYTQGGRYEESLELHKETLLQRTKVLGPEHPATMLSMHSIANAYEEAGHHKEALASKKESLVMRKEVLGPEHPDTLQSMNSLAQTYRIMGRHEEAVTLHEETLKSAKGVIDPDLIFMHYLMDQLAISYRSAGRYEEAMALQKETVGIRKEKQGSEHPETITSMNYLARCYADMGRDDEALALYTEILVLRKKVSGLEHERTLHSMNALAYSYRKTDHYKEAEKQWLEAIPLMEKNNSRYLKLAIQGLVGLYKERSKLEKAKDWQAKLDALNKGE